MSTAKKLIVFDMDGTLVNSQHSHMQAVKEAWEKAVTEINDIPEVYRNISPQDLRWAAGYNLDMSIGNIASLKAREAGLEKQAEYDLEDAILNAVDKDFFSTRKKELDERGHEQAIYKDIPHVLEELKREGYALAIITRRQQAFQTPEQNKLAHYFDAVIQLPHHDKKAEHLLDVMSKFGVSPENTVMIGDQVDDIDMATGAGVHALHVQWGYGIYIGGSDHKEVQDVADIPQMVGQLTRSKTTRRIGPTSSQAHPRITGPDVDPNSRTAG